jgi:hypothetical protein
LQIWLHHYHGLHKLCKSFFIPTPGQYEQEYLAKKLMKEGLVPYATQDDFKFSDLEMVHDYKGFRSESRIE